MSSENSVSLHETESNDIVLNDSHILGINNIKCEVQPYANMVLNQQQAQLIPQLGYPYEYMQENGNNFNGMPNFNFNNDHRLQYYNNYNVQQYVQNNPLNPYLANTMNHQTMINPNIANVEAQLINNDMNSSKASSELNSSYNNRSNNGKIEKDDRYKMRRSKNNQAAKKCRDKKKSEIDRVFEDKKRLESNAKSMEHLIQAKDIELAKRSSDINQLSHELNIKNMELNKKNMELHQKNQELNEKDQLIKQLQNQLQQYY